MNLFFYGTLRAEQVRQAVLGPHHAELKIGNARLAGHEVRQVSGALYPMIVQADDQQIVSGLIVYDVQLDVLALIDKFEGVHYHRKQVTVETENGHQQAEIYCPDSEMQPAGLWDFDSWVIQDMPQFFEQDFAPEGVATPAYVAHTKTEGKK